MFSYNPELATSLDRVRFALGDTAAPGLIPDETIASLIASHTTTTTTTAADGAETTTSTIDEEAVIRDAARGLAAQYANKPSEISTANGRIAWAERISQWNKIATGGAGGATAGRLRRATGLTIRRGPARDYSTGQGDAT